jgi:hypothetical protein
MVVNSNIPLTPEMVIVSHLWLWGMQLILVKFSSAMSEYLQSINPSDDEPTKVSKSLLDIFTVNDNIKQEIWLRGFIGC